MMNKKAYIVNKEAYNIGEFFTVNNNYKRLNRLRNRFYKCIRKNSYDGIIDRFDIVYKAEIP